MRFEVEGDTNGIKSCKIMDDSQNPEIEIGGIDLEIQNKIGNVYIENIIIDQKYRGKGYLRKVVESLKSRFKPYSISCLPLPQHTPKFERIGFMKDILVGEDQYYKY